MVKIGLGIICLTFDIIFIIQHAIYKKPTPKSFKNVDIETSCILEKGEIVALKAPDSETKLER